MLGRRGDAQVAYREALAGEIHRLAGPAAANDLDSLLHQAGAMRQLAAELVKFELAVTDAHAQVKAPAGDQ